MPSDVSQAVAHGETPFDCMALLVFARCIFRDLKHVADNLRPWADVARRLRKPGLTEMPDAEAFLIRFFKSVCSDGVAFWSAPRSILAPGLPANLRVARSYDMLPLADDVNDHAALPQKTLSILDAAWHVVGLIDTLGAAGRSSGSDIGWGRARDLLFFRVTSATPEAKKNIVQSHATATKAAMNISVFEWAGSPSRGVASIELSHERPCKLDLSAINLFALVTEPFRWSHAESSMCNMQLPPRVQQHLRQLDDM